MSWDPGKGGHPGGWRHYGVVISTNLHSLCSENIQNIKQALQIGIHCELLKYLYCWLVWNWFWWMMGISKFRALHLSVSLRENNNCRESTTEWLHRDDEYWYWILCLFEIEILRLKCRPGVSISQRLVSSSCSAMILIIMDQDCQYVCYGITRRILFSLCLLKFFISDQF